MPGSSCRPIAVCTAVRASKSVESKVGKGETSGVISKGKARLHPPGARYRDVLVTCTRRSLGHYLSDVQSGQGEVRTGPFQGQVRGVVRADDEVSASMGESLYAAGRVRPESDRDCRFPVRACCAPWRCNPNVRRDAGVRRACPSHVRRWPGSTAPLPARCGLKRQRAATTDLSSTSSISLTGCKSSSLRCFSATASASSSGPTARRDASSARSPFVYPYLR